MPPPALLGTYAPPRVRVGQVVECHYRIGREAGGEGEGRPAGEGVAVFKVRVR